VLFHPGDIAIHPVLEEFFAVLIADVSGLSRSNCTPYNPQWVENTVAESKVLASVLGESC
jgi:hypothetical protein